MQDLMLIVFIFPLIFYLGYRKIFNPVTIFIGILSLQYLIYLVFSPWYYPLLSPKYEITLLYVLWGFFIGYAYVSVLACFVNNKISLSYIVPIFPHRRFVSSYRFFLYLSFFVFFSHAYVGINNGLEGGYSFWVNVRMVYLENKGSFGLLPHLAIFLQVYFLSAIVYKYRYRVSVFLFFMVSISPVIFKLERTSLLTSLMALMVMHECARNNGINVIRLCVYVVLFIVFFLLVAYQFAPERPVFDLFMVLVNYFSKNILMLDRYVLTSVPNGELAPLLGPYSKLFGLSSSDQAFIDGAFNTYSFIRVPYLYGGQFFLFLFSLFLGSISSCIYISRYRMGGYIMVFYSFWSVSLLLSFFDYTYAWSNWVYYLISTLICYTLYGELLYKSKGCMRGEK